MDGIARMLSIQPLQSARPEAECRLCLLVGGAAKPGVIVDRVLACYLAGLFFRDMRRSRRSDEAVRMPAARR